MLIPRGSQYWHHRGTSLVEVMVTVVILAFGLLGVAGLQSKVGLVEMESYQRAQAILALAEITERINANRSQAASYVTAGTLGTGDTQPTDCTTVAAGPPRDLCEWSNSLKGAGEQITTTNPATNVGGIVGARGCITQLQAPNATLGVCSPGTYQVSVAWQGMSPTTSQAPVGALPGLACAQGSYGSDDRYRRVIATQIVIAPQMPNGTTSCF